MQYLAKKNEGQARVAPPPPVRPPPPKIFGQEDDPQVKVDLPEAPTTVPDINLQPRNPKLYELVSMSQDASFWWDSVDSDETLQFSGGLTPAPGLGLEGQMAGLEIGNGGENGTFTIDG